MIRAPVAGVASIKGLMEASGATSSAVVTIASVGTDRLRRTHKHLADPQGSSTKAILAIEPLDNLVHQLAGKRNLVESPTLDPGIDFQCLTVGDTRGRVDQPRPYKCAGRS